MTGVIGALVALAVVLALVVVLAVRPPARRLSRALAGLRDDTAAKLARLSALRRARPTRSGSATPVPSTSSPAPAWPSSVRGRGRHRRMPGRS